jgi:Glycosyl hydrolase family 76
LSCSRTHILRVPFGLLAARAARSRLAGAVALVAALLPAGPSAPAFARGRIARRARSVNASAYPAGAQRPLKVARRSEFAHGSSAGGVPAGPSSPRPAPSATRPSPSAKSKRPAPKRSAPRLRGNPARSLLALGEMQRYFSIPGTGLYIGEPYSYLWPFSQAFAATVSVTEMPGQSKAQLAADMRELHTRIYGLGRYWGPAGQTLPGRAPAEERGEDEEPAEGQPPSEGPSFVATMPSYNGNVVPPGGISYYDDNEWVGLELVRSYELLHEAPLLERAQQIMAFVMSAWQTNQKLACAGGIPFSDSPNNTDRNTITDGPAAELALRLYKLTSNPAYLQFALTAYEWVRACLLAPSGLYADHIRPHGAIDGSLWSYNQGVMMGAGAMLYQATGNSLYLWQARQTAKAALSYFTLARLDSEIPFFPSVFFRNLMYLDSITRDPPGPRLAQAYVNQAWASRRLRDNLFVFGSPASSQLLVQAAIVQIYALLSEPASTYF